MVPTGSQRPSPALALADSLRYWWENTIVIIFIVDVFFNFRTGYIDKLNNMVTSPKLIARNYFRSWFTLDILRCDGLGMGCHSLNFTNFTVIFSRYVFFCKIGDASAQYTPSDTLSDALIPSLCLDQWNTV